MDGKCYCCEKDINNRTAKRHILTCKNRLKSIEESLEKSKSQKDKFIIKMVDKYRTNEYAIYLSIDEETSLRSLDTFIRDVWVECCGHLSSFEIYGITYSCSENLDGDYFDDDETMDIKLQNVISVGDKFQYDYDYGSTTSILLEVIDEYTTGKSESTIEILARNNEIQHMCYECNNKAQYFDYENEEFVCGECVEIEEDDDEEEFLMELGYTNSPRDGVCGYEGHKESENEYLKGNKTKFKNQLQKKSRKINNDVCDIEELKNMLTEEFEAGFIKSLEKLSKDLISRSLKCKASNDLEELLKANTNDHIKYLLDNLGISYKSSDKKEILINKFKGGYKEAINEVFKYIDKDCYNDLKLIIKNNGIIENENLKDVKSMIFLEKMGIIYHSCNESNDLCISSPKEILEEIERIDIKYINKNDEIIKLFKGMLYYYGVVSIQEFINRLPKGENIDLMDLEVDNIEKILRLSSEIYMEYEYINGVGMNQLINDGLEVSEIIDRESASKDDFKQFTKKELLKASRCEYIGDDSIYKPLIKVLKENYNIENGNINEFKESVYLCSQFEKDETRLIQYLVDTLENSKFIENEIIESATKVYNKIPLWKYKGYSKLERQNLNKTNWETVKIGRNDPCNCGSGKKYKKCCGGKVIQIGFN